MKIGSGGIELNDFWLKRIIVIDFNNFALAFNNDWLLEVKSEFQLIASLIVSKSKHLTK